MSPQRFTGSVDSFRTHGGSWVSSGALGNHWRHGPGWPTTIRPRQWWLQPGGGGTAGGKLAELPGIGGVTEDRYEGPHLDAFFLLLVGSSFGHPSSDLNRTRTEVWALIIGFESKLN